jgi:hypothetical protein
MATSCGGYVVCIVVVTPASKLLVSLPDPENETEIEKWWWVSFNTQNF